MNKKYIAIVIILGLIVVLAWLHPLSNTTLPNQLSGQVAPSTTATSSSTSSDNSQIDTNLKQSEDSVNSLPDSFNPSQLNDSTLGK